MTNSKKLTDHCRIRAQQRGIRLDHILAVQIHSDRSTRRGGGRTCRFISRRRLNRIGSRTPEGVSTDFLDGLMVLEGKNSVVTAFRERKRSIYRRRDL